MTVEHVFNKYYVYGQTDCGRCREHNEDNILINSHAALVMVADGMGGHQYGDRASLEAVNLINYMVEKYLPNAEMKQRRLSIIERLIQFFYKQVDANLEFDDQLQMISDILVETNHAIYQINQHEQLPDGSGMGTTIVGCRMISQSEKMLVFHVGDSRLYRLRNNHLSQITKDHSVYQLWLDTGQIGKQPGKNVILQGLGPKSEIKPEVQLIDVLMGDSFLLCSDGLNDMVEQLEIEKIVQNLSNENIKEKVEQLIAAANANGGVDNISVILICQ